MRLARGFQMRLAAMFAVSAALHGQNAPTGLKVVSASRSSVMLTWTGDASATNGYVVLRQTVGVSDFAPIAGGAVTQTSVMDNNIDGQATYLYQVVSVAGMNQSPPSAPAIVGPAPYGYNTVVPQPASIPDDEQGNFGESLSMCLDGNGDPAVAYEWDDVMNLGDKSTSTIYFARWNRALYTWQGPVKIAVVGGNQGTGGLTPAYTLGVGCDASNGNFAIAYDMLGQGRLDFALSTDGGLTFKTQTIVTNSEDQFLHPRLALYNGSVHLGIFDDNQNASIVYYTGSETAAASGWTKKVVPQLGNGVVVPFDLQLDSAGTPGIAFWSYPKSGYNSVLTFWRPSYASSMKAGDSNGVQNDGAAASLAFSGTSPRIGSSIHRMEDALNESGVYTVAASDAGQVWAPMVAVPQDGVGQGYGGDIALAAGSKSQGMILMSLLTGYGSDVAPLCGEPKTGTTSDFVTWNTCAPSGPTGPSLQGAAWFTSKYDYADNVYLSFSNVDNTDVTPGIVVFRRPPPGAGLPPHINTGGVVDGASFGSTIAAGGIATIFGANFIGAATGASSVPLPRELGGVTVLVNGESAPLIYVGLNQINFQMPYEAQAGQVTVEVISNRLSSNPVTAHVSTTQPTIFTHGSNAAAVQQDGQDANSVTPGKTIVMYATGCGATNPSIPTGYAAQGTPLALCPSTTATIGGKDAPVSFAGMTPGFAGLMQINLTVPTLANGTYPVQITVGGVKSNTPTLQVANPN